MYPRLLNIGEKGFSGLSGGFVTELVVGGVIPWLYVQIWGNGAKEVRVIWGDWFGENCCPSSETDAYWSCRNFSISSFDPNSMGGFKDMSGRKILFSSCCIDAIILSSFCANSSLIRKFSSRTLSSSLVRSSACIIYILIFLDESHFNSEGSNVTFKFNSLSSR